MTPAERDPLIAQATSAWRPRDADGGARFHPAFCDLDGPGRRELHEQLIVQRRLEAALDPDGLTTTAHAVLHRIRGQ
ncbi:MAG TPA: hypothetical protein ENI87_05820 [bacterium]|nr:hypothetical protein [bacterium]